MWVSLKALGQGFSLCLKPGDVRRLAVRPWLIGAVIYLLCLLPVFYLADDLAHWMVGSGDGLGAQFLYALALAISFLLLFASSMTLALTLTLVLSAVFQEEIARSVLGARPDLAPRLQAADSLNHSLRAAGWELGRLLWLLPVFLLIALIGLIPLLAPLALMLACWFLAFQFVDLVLAVLGVNAFRRFGLAARRPFLMLTFGALLTLLWALPFLGIFLTPIAVAAAASLVLNSSLLSEVLPTNGSTSDGQ